MSAPDFKPSQLVLHVPIPFLGTFRNVERECAAAYMVLALRELHGDEWGAVVPRDCGHVLKKYNADHAYTWLTNPFCFPDFVTLVTDGFAEFIGPDEGNPRGRPIRFTDAGFEAMRRWVRCEHCKLPSTPEGHDGCLGTIPGAMNACCGHGDVKCAYIQYRADDAPDAAGAWHCCCVGVDGIASHRGRCARCGDERTFRIAGEDVFAFLRKAAAGSGP